MSERWQELLGRLDGLTPPASLVDRVASAQAAVGTVPRASRRHTAFILAALVGLVALTAGIAMYAHELGGSATRPRFIQGLGPGVSKGIVVGPQPGGELSGVAASGPNDVWAVGGIRRKGHFTDQALLEHWDGTSWRTVSCPGVGGLLAVTVPEPGDVWAIGETALVNWRDGQCHRIRLPRAAGQGALADIASTGPHSIWVCGEQPGTHFRAENFTGWNTLVARWNGSTWHVYRTPNRSKRANYVHGIVALSSTDVWAAGYSQTARGVPLTLSLHWNGSRWRLAKTPNPGRGENVVWGMGSDQSHVWAVGQYAQTKNHEKLVGLLMRLDGTTWRVTAPPVNHRSFTASALSGTGSNDVWVAGSWPNRGLTLIHYDGHEWSAHVIEGSTAEGSTLGGVLAISRADAWAVGTIASTRGRDRPLIVHWDGTAWQTVALSVD